jgi:hypothetical protein
VSNRKNCLLVLFLAVAWPLVAASVSWAVTALEEATQAARDGLGRFFKAIPLSELRYFGFQDQEELARAGPGATFLVYTLLPEDIFAAAEGEPIEVEIHPTDTWKFPVLCAGTPRTLL